MLTDGLKMQVRYFWRVSWYSEMRYFWLLKPVFVFLLRLITYKKLWRMFCHHEIRYFRHYIVVTTISFHEMLTVHCTFNWTRSKSSSSGKFFALILLKYISFNILLAYTTKKLLRRSACLIIPTLSLVFKEFYKFTNSLVSHIF